MLVFDYKSGIRDLNEKIKEMEEEVEAENFYWAKIKAQKVLQRIEGLGDLEDKEKLMGRLICQYGDRLPITEKGYSEWRKKYSNKELNALFEGIFAFKNSSCGGGRAIWYTSIGMPIKDACDAANCKPSELHHQPGERIVRREFFSGDAWYGDITRFTRVALLSSQIEIWDTIEQILSHYII